MTLALRTVLGSSDEQHGTATLKGSSQYRNVEELRGGGRAQLHVALSGALGASDLVVIKRFAAPRTAAGLTELTEEIALARRLDHDAIARCRAIGFEAGSYFLVSDYLDGIPLDVLLRAAALRGARLSNAVVARILLAIVNAVDYADQIAPSPAARALVHQTVTIEDVFLTLDGDVKLLGFKGGRLGAAVSSEAAAIDALLSGHLTRELALVLHHAVRPAPGGADAAAAGAGERYAQIRGALQQWQARSVRAQGRAETARAVRAALTQEMVERRARIAAARAAEAPPPEVAPETQPPGPSSDEPPVSGMRPALRAEPAQPPPLPAPSPLDDDEATIAEPARPGVEVQFAPVAPRRRRIVPYVLAAIGASTLVLAYAMRPPARASATVPPGVRAASALSASAPTDAVAAAPATNHPAPSLATASVAAPITTPVSYRREPEVPSPATPGQSAGALPASKPPTPPVPVATTPAAAPPAAATATAAVTAFAGARLPTAAPSESHAVPSEKPTRPGTPAPEGHLTLDSTPWAAVYLGGTLLGQTPLVELSLPAGDHALELVNPDQGISTSYVVHIEGGKTTVRRVGLEQPGAPQ